MRQKVAKLLKKYSVATTGHEGNQKSLKRQWNALDHKHRGLERKRVLHDIRLAKSIKDKKETTK